MNVRLFAGAVFAVLSAVSAADAQLDPSLFAIGPCGGPMTGYNGRIYMCERDRRPVCERSTGRCVCLLRTDCGGKRNEPF